jgi:hypothetical protein
MGGRHDRDPNGQQYGWIAPDQEVSGHEDEYVNAGGMPKLVYVQSPVPDRDPRLKEMLSRIQRTDCPIAASGAASAPDW